MEFWLTEEQVMFRDSVARFLADRHAIGDRLRARSDAAAFSDAEWRSIAELGWLAAPFPEAYGGIGGSTTDMALVMEQLGRVLLPCPYLSSVVLGGTMLLHCGSARQKERFLAKICAGEMRVALAYAESSAGSDLSRMAAVARPVAGDYEISGSKTFVLDGGLADCLLVAARSADGPGDGRLSIFAVPRAAAGIRVEPHRMRDGSETATIHFSSVRAGPEDVIGRPGQGAELLGRVLDVAAAMICMEAVGAMWAAYHLTLDYMKVRTQFGQKIGSFQALQHRMVDVYTQCQMAQSIAMGAVAALESDDAALRTRMCSAAKLRVGATARKVGEECVQLHGGIGMTREHPVGHYLKRLNGIRTSFGDENHHLQRYVACFDPDNYASR